MNPSAQGLRKQGGRRRVMLTSDEDGTGQESLRKTDLATQRLEKQGGRRRVRLTCEEHWGNLNGFLLIVFKYVAQKLQVENIVFLNLRHKNYQKSLEEVKAFCLHVFDV